MYRSPPLHVVCAVSRLSLQVFDLVNSVLESMRPNAGAPAPPAWSKRGAAGAARWRPPSKDAIARAVVEQLARWDRLSAVLPPEGPCAWDEHLQYCRAKRQREGEVLRAEMREYGQQLAAQWDAPEHDEMALCGQIADGILRSLLDDTVAEACRVKVRQLHARGPLPAPKDGRPAPRPERGLNANFHSRTSIDDMEKRRIARELVTRTQQQGNADGGGGMVMRSRADVRGHGPRSSLDVSAQGVEEARAEENLHRQVYLETIFAQLEKLVAELSTAERLADQWDPLVQSWSPKPIDLSAIVVPPQIVQIVEQCASSIHRKWVSEQRQKGWRYHRNEDEESMRGPQICNYRQLREEHKEPNRKLARFTVKVVTAMGFTFVPNTDQAAVRTANRLNLVDATRGGDGPAPRSRSATVAAVDDEEEQLPQQLDGLVKVLAACSHELWAHEKFKAGWQYGAERNNDKKINPLLVPFFKLSHDEVQSNMKFAQAPLLHIVSSGYDIVPAEEGYALQAIDASRAEGKTKEALQLQKADLEMASVLQGAVEAKRIRAVTGSTAPRMGPRGSVLARVGSRAVRRAGTSRDLLRRLSRRARGITPAHLRSLPGAVAKSCADAARAVLRHAESPHSRYMFWVDAFAVSFVLYYFLTVPLQCGFQQATRREWQASNGRWGALAYVDSFGELYLLLDFMQQCFVWRARGAAHRRARRRATVNRMEFLLEMVGSLPVGLALLLREDVVRPDLRFLPLLKLLHVCKLFVHGRWRNVGKQAVAAMRVPALGRLFSLVAGLLVFLHVVACLYWALRQEWPFEDEVDDLLLQGGRAGGAGGAGILQGASEPSTFSGQPISERRWRCPPGLRSAADQDYFTGCGDGRFGAQYITALYWALLAMLGSDMLPNTEWEATYTFVVSFAGLIVLSGVIGVFSALVTNLDAHHEMKRRHMNLIDSFMKLNSVPAALRSDINDYYDYIFRNDSSAQVEALFDKLPPCLDVQLQMALKSKLIERNEFFQQCSAQCMVALVRRLRSRVAIPHELVVNASMPGEAMFFVVVGKLESFEEVAGMMDVHETYQSGDSFGLVAFFVPNRMHDESVRSITFSTLECLSYDKLQELVDLYDEVTDQVAVAKREYVRRLERTAFNNGGAFGSSPAFESRRRTMRERAESLSPKDSAPRSLNKRSLLHTGRMDSVKSKGILRASMGRPTRAAAAGERSPSPAPKSTEEQVATVAALHDAVRNLGRTSPSGPQTWTNDNMRTERSRSFANVPQHAGGSRGGGGDGGGEGG
eukprot:g6151.t1